jgi:hypothetical protein
MIHITAISEKPGSMTEIKIVIGCEVPDRCNHYSQKLGKIESELLFKYIQEKIIYPEAYQ